MVDLFSMLQLLAKRTHVKESLVVVPTHMWPHIPIIGNFEIKRNGQEGWNESKKLKAKEKKKKIQNELKIHFPQLSEWFEKTLRSRI